MSTGSQLIDLTIGASSINLGTVSFDLSAFLGGFSTQGDNAKLKVEFLNAASQLLASTTIGPVTNVERSNTTGLLFRETSGIVPSGTRSARLVLTLTRTEGAYNDGYADNLSLILREPVPGPLPLLGAGAAFGFCRKLRKRVKLNRLG